MAFNFAYSVGTDVDGLSYTASLATDGTFIGRGGVPIKTDEDLELAFSVLTELHNDRPVRAARALFGDSMITADPEPLAVNCSAGLGDAPESCPCGCDGNYLDDEDPDYYADNEDYLDDGDDDYGEDHDDGEDASPSLVVGLTMGALHTALADPNGLMIGQTVVYSYPGAYNEEGTATGVVSGDSGYEPDEERFCVKTIGGTNRVVMVDDLSPMIETEDDLENPPFIKVMFDGDDKDAASEFLDKICAMMETHEDQDPVDEDDIVHEEEPACRFCC